MGKIMTFEEWRATRRFTPNLLKEEGSDGITEGPGYVYAGGCYIELVSERWPDQESRNKGAFHLCVGRDSHLSFDIEPLERELYDFATSECGIEAPAPDAVICDAGHVQEEFSTCLYCGAKPLEECRGDASRAIIRKGDEVQIVPEWQDKGDEKYRRFALEDEDGGRVLIVADLGLPLNPTSRLPIYMLRKV